MNSNSIGAVAAAVGASRRRVAEAAVANGWGTRHGSRWSFTSQEVARLTRVLGVNRPVPGLTRSEAVVLAELSMRPRGLISARAIARACSLAPATASSAVLSLISAGLIIEQEEVVALGHARRVRMLHANLGSPRWAGIVDRLRAVRAHHRPPSPAAESLPDHVAQAFWNVPADTFSRLTARRDGPFIAARAVTTGDPQLLAYAAATLAPSAWASVSTLRGLTVEQADLAENLARRRG